MTALGDAIRANAAQAEDVERQRDVATEAVVEQAARIDELEAQVADLTARLAACEAGQAPPVDDSFFAGDWIARTGAKFLDHPENLSQPVDPDRGVVLEAVTPAGEQFGFGTFLPLDPVDDLTRTYDVWFPADYQWVSRTDSNGPHGGGKLPGLAGVMPGVPEWAVGAGGKRYAVTAQITRKADVPKMTGWSCRLLWLNDRRVQCYLYAPDLRHLGRIDGTEGTQGWRCYGWSKTLVGPDGKPLKIADLWNTISVRCAMNAPGSANGLLEVSLNGVVGLRVPDVVFRTRADVKVTQDFLTWYAGGGPIDYPTVDNRVRIDDLR